MYELPRIWNKSQQQEQQEQEQQQQLLNLYNAMLALKIIT